MHMTDIRKLWRLLNNLLILKGFAISQSLFYYKICRIPCPKLHRKA